MPFRDETTDENDLSGGAVAEELDQPDREERGPVARGCPTW